MRHAPAAYRRRRQEMVSARGWGRGRGEKELYSGVVEGRICGRPLDTRAARGMPRRYSRDNAERRCGEQLYSV
jgi:hypothetical protein